MSSLQWVEKKTSGWVQLAKGVDVEVAAEPVHSNCVSLTLLGDFNHEGGAPLSWHPKVDRLCLCVQSFFGGFPCCLISKWTGPLSVVVTKKFFMHGLSSKRLIYFRINHFFAHYYSLCERLQSFLKVIAWGFVCFPFSGLSDLALFSSYGCIIVF